MSKSQPKTHYKYHPPHTPLKLNYYCHQYQYYPNSILIFHGSRGKQHKAEEPSAARGRQVPVFDVRQEMQPSGKEAAGQVLHSPPLHSHASLLARAHRPLRSLSLSLSIYVRSFVTNSCVLLLLLLFLSYV